MQQAQSVVVPATVDRRVLAREVAEGLCLVEVPAEVALVVLVGVADDGSALDADVQRVAAVG